MNATAKALRAKNRPLTGKQGVFVQYLIENPKATAVDAYKEAYDADKSAKGTIQTEAKRTLRNPSVMSELSKYTNLVENTLINTINEWGNHEKPRQRELALDAAKYVHDKVHGRAKQQVEMTSTSVSINIDLTGAESPDTTA